MTASARIIPAITSLPSYKRAPETDKNKQIKCTHTGEPKFIQLQLFLIHSHTCVFQVQIDLY
jgi:hypothetical protein